MSRGNTAYQHDKSIHWLYKSGPLLETSSHASDDYAYCEMWLPSLSMINITGLTLEVHEAREGTETDSPNVTKVYYVCPTFIKFFFYQGVYHAFNW